MEKNSVLPIVKRVMKSKQVTGADIARALNMHPTSVNGMLHRPTMQVHKLADLSHFLQYNFFRELAEKLPYAEPDCSDPELAKENKDLKNRVKELELEVNILRQTIRELAGK
ncbi:hypothetical protein [Draconibacterium halophilum]|uniref:HTH cro/C1-type domain-containing protein n=1 Tax=Draconibacterium halophilum TaxID=2706887 RepID=A0A6C0RG99_9BACT|nr:hypothetical protein [Draconibacterium halophilum]QIA09534.1 hypothetical protein G0Q07_18275 [Draconibacterium halophilum]